MLLYDFLLLSRKIKKKEKKNKNRQNKKSKSTEKIKNTKHVTEDTHILTLNEFEEFSTDIKEDLIDQLKLKDFDEARDLIKQCRVKFSQKEYEKMKPISQAEFDEVIEKLELKNFCSFFNKKQEKVANQETFISHLIKTLISLKFAISLPINEVLLTLILFETFIRSEILYGGRSRLVIFPIFISLSLLQPLKIMMN